MSSSTSLAAGLASEYKIKEFLTFGESLQLAAGSFNCSMAQAKQALGKLQKLYLSSIIRAFRFFKEIKCLEKGTIQHLRIIKEIEHAKVEKLSIGLILLIITILMPEKERGHYD